MISEGLNFSRKYTELTRSYRSPVNGFMVVTGLLFRWFANTGPKVKPDVVPLRTHAGRTLEVFKGISGIKIENLPAGDRRHCLVMRNDSHLLENSRHFTCSNLVSSALGWNGYRTEGCRTRNSSACLKLTNRRTQAP